MRCSPQNSVEYSPQHPHLAPRIGSIVDAHRGVVVRVIHDCGDTLRVRVDVERELGLTTSLGVKEITSRRIAKLDPGSAHKRYT